MLRGFLLSAQPPLLGEEGKKAATTPHAINDYLSIIIYCFDSSPERIPLRAKQRNTATHAKRCRADRSNRLLGIDRHRRLAIPDAHSTEGGLSRYHAAQRRWKKDRGCVGSCKGRGCRRTVQRL